MRVCIPALDDEPYSISIGACTVMFGVCIAMFVACIVMIGTVLCCVYAFLFAFSLPRPWLVWYVLSSICVYQQFAYSKFILLHIRRSSYYHFLFSRITISHFANHLDILNLEQNRLTTTSAPIFSPTYLFFRAPDLSTAARFSTNTGDDDNDDDDDNFAERKRPGGVFPPFSPFCLDGF